MKKQYRVVSLLIVLSLLLASFMFVTASAEETSDVGKLLDGYTSVPNADGAALLNAIKYTDSSMGTNLLNGAGISSTNSTDTITWGNEGGRGSDLITYPDGNVVHKEYLVGTAMTDFGTKGNDYINYTFTKVDNTKVDGKNEYIIVDFDFAYYGTLDAITMQVITRGNDAYWATTAQFRNFVKAPNKFVHVTAVYNYQDGASYIFVNGSLAQKIANGALTSTGLTDRNGGTSMGASEFRVGSNSTSTFFLDNLYIRNIENATGSDDLATALTGSSITGWSKNIYTSEYELPAFPVFALTYTPEAYANNSITDGANYLGQTPDVSSHIYGVTTGNQGNSDFLTISKVAAENPYLLVYANKDTDYTGANNNLFINGNANASDPYSVIGDDLKAYYVIDFDVATHGNTLPGIDISVVQRRESDTAGFPFSDEIYFSGAVKETGEWVHLTVVGDIRNNVAMIFINGKLVNGNAGLAVRNDTTDANKLGANDTKVKNVGFRVELTRNNVQALLDKGDNIAFDNFSERIYVNGNDALTAALADYNITDWAGYITGRAGEMLPTIATVNGESYSNTHELKKALYTNDPINVEFWADPLAPTPLRANATIDTHGLGIENLIVFDNACSAPENDGNKYTVTAPFTENLEEVEVDYTSDTTARNDVTPVLKSDVEDNIFNRYSPVSATSVTNWNTTGYRKGTILSNPLTGDTFYHETATPNASGKLNEANEYINLYFNSTTLSYESGKNEYIVVDFDFAHDELVDSGLNFSLIPRNGGGRWGAGMSLSSFGLTAGEVTHLTIVADYTNNISYVYKNGVFSHTVSGGPVNSTGYDEYKSGTSLTITEFKLGSNSLNSVYLANLAIRFFDLDASNDLIKAANDAKDITKWYGSVYNEDYEVPQLPAIAKVDGVEYSSKASLEAALSTLGEKTVYLLHSTTEAITVASNATIYTNGLTHNFGVIEGGLMSESEGVITVKTPNYSLESGIAEGSSTLTNHAYIDTVKYPANDNLFYKFYYNNYQKSGTRAAYIMTNKDTGHKYIYDTIFDTTTAGANTYFNWYFSGDAATLGKGYTLGANQYIVVDFDMALDHYDEDIEFNVVTRDEANTNLAGARLNINTAMRSAGILEGDFAHITMLFEVDTNTGYVYVNGTKYLTVARALASQEALVAGNWCDGFRMLQNKDVGVKYDNVYMRVVNDASLKNLNSVEGHSINVYTDSYELPVAPAIATVDGVNYASVKALTNVLNARRAVELATFHRSIANPIPVTVDAVVETNGFDTTVVPGVGASISKTEGTKLYIVGVFKPSATYEVIKEDGTAASFTGLSNTSVAGNLFNGNASEANPGSFRYVKYTGFENNDPYLLIQPIAEKTPGNTFINMITTSAKITATSYFVFDMDVATETDFIDKFGITILQRSDFSNAGGTDFNKVGDTNAVVFDDFIDPSDEWAHLTIVGDLADNKEYVFVNGTLVGELTLVTAANYDLESHVASGNFTVQGVRVNMPGNVAVNLYDTALIDNLALRYYDNNTAAGNVESAISAGTLAGYANAVTGRAGEKLPAIATVNGVEHGNYFKAAEALVSDRKINATLDRESVATKYLGEFVIDALGTVKTNGFSYSLAPGLTGALNNGILTITIDETTGHVKVVVSGTVIYEGDLVSGTDVQAILDSMGAYGTKVVAGNGNIFLNVTWENAPGIVNGDATYTGTGTKFDGPVYIYYISSGNQVDPNAYAYDAAGMKSWIGNGNDFTMILNQNVDVAKTATISAGSALKTKNIYLNGYDMSFTGGDHAINVGDNAYSLNFYGPGNINDLEHTNTHAFFFASYGHTGKVTLNNLTMNLSQRLASLRGGNIEVNNCEIYAYSAFDTELIMVGEDYNGNWTKNPISVAINDSFVRFGTSNIRVTNAVELPLIKHKVVSSGEEVQHNISISGSTIITEHSLYELTNNPSATKTTPTIEKSTIIAASLSSNGKVKFVNDVKINSNMENLSNAIIPEGVELVKSNSHMADAMYTDYYATVVWPDGTTELWADGSTPVSKNYPLAMVGTVDGYGEYRFADSYGATPFALSGNLTLGSGIAFNLYVDLDSVAYIIVNGKKIEGEARNVAGEAMTCFTVELAPADAAFAFDVIFVVNDGNMITRTMSVADYAEKVFTALANDTKTKKMMSATLEYIVSAAQYFSNKANMSAISAVLSAHPATTVSNPTASSADTSAIAEYITGAQLNIVSTLKFRFNLADGVDASMITITVNGVEKAFENHGSYIELALRAYEMADMITITVNGNTGTYDLAKYAVTVLANMGSGATADTFDQKMNRKFASDVMKTHVKGNLLNAIYAYALAADEYKA